MDNIAQFLIITGIILTMTITVPTLLIYIYLLNRRTKRD